MKKERVYVYYLVSLDTIIYLLNQYLLSALCSLDTVHVAKDINLKRSWPLLCGGREHS